MGTGWKFNSKARTRPVKIERERRRRQKVQRNRLISLGLSEDHVRKMQPNEVREALRRPARIAAGA